MSARSIAAYEAHRRANAPTRPPPPADDTIAELERQERRHAHRASRELARARECRAMIEHLRAEASEREAIESGVVDTDDARHPRHPLSCARPCCAPKGTK